MPQCVRRVFSLFFPFLGCTTQPLCKAFAAFLPSEKLRLGCCAALGSLYDLAMQFEICFFLLFFLHLLLCNCGKLRLCLCLFFHSFTLCNTGPRTCGRFRCLYGALVAPGRYCLPETVQKSHALSGLFWTVFPKFVLPVVFRSFPTGLFAYLLRVTFSVLAKLVLGQDHFG